MKKLAWSDLHALHREPHLLAIRLPDTFLNPRLAQELMIRVIRKLPLNGEYAVVISREDGRQQILCAFGNSFDVDLVANATGAPKQTDSRQRYLVLDEAAEDRLFEIGGPGNQRSRSRPA